MKAAPTLLIVLIVLLLSQGASAQVQAYAMATPGAYMQAGRTTVFAGWLGFEAPLLTVEERGFSFVSRVGVYYVDLEDDIQGFSVFVAGKKSFACGYTPSMYALIGGGLTYDIVDGYDPIDAAIKMEFGLDIYRSFGIGVGVDYIPDPLTDDKWFIYGSLDLTPVLCRW
jgi:hypothetical protein